MSSAAEPVDPRVSRLVDDLLRPLFEADGGRILEVRKEGEGYVVVVGGSMAACPALELTSRHVVTPAFERALGARVRVRLEPRPGAT